MAGAAFADAALTDQLKIILVGNGEVGKSSLARRFCKGEFTTQYKRTIGADFLERQLYLPDVRRTAHLLLWDTAGQEVFDALSAQYYRGAHGCVLAFSTVDQASLLAVQGWKDKVEAVCGVNEVPMVLIQTKIDRQAEPVGVVNAAEADALAAAMGLPLFRTSSTDNTNVDNAFQCLARECLHRLHEQVMPSQQTQPAVAGSSGSRVVTAGSLGPPHESAAQKKRCCRV
eukprot:NODE_3806_length_913_cov_20.108796_g3500_i0.p1 GENE.NODE_3806_length_913_cov_20.108796_g3500_i0~~NODE_3806_length_913_cov_20.108796_g3500_i0.p1  ORF type:complete len:229 (+),score=41.75 NODE_3806_length_913_cov_20.108796_g3500_i0:160-846(+)